MTPFFAITDTLTDDLFHNYSYMLVLRLFSDVRAVKDFKIRLWGVGLDT